MRLYALALALALGGSMENSAEAGPGDRFARLHQLGLTFVVGDQPLPTERPLTEAEVRAAVERRNAYWINHDFDRDQLLNADVVDPDLAVEFLRGLGSQPAAVLEALKAAPLDLAAPELKLRRGLGLGARALARPWQLAQAGGRWTLEAGFDLDETVRQLRVAAAEEPLRQQALAAADAQLAATAAPDPKLRVARETAYRRLLVIQRPRLQLSTALAAQLGAGAHEEFTAAALQTEIARLRAALKNAPMWGTRLPPPPPSTAKSSAPASAPTAKSAAPASATAKSAAPAKPSAPKAARRETAVAWSKTGDAEHPYEARVAGARWVVRINDFPAEDLYSLLVDGVEVEHFNDWPKAWQKP
jgi:hypothetical protein